MSTRVQAGVLMLALAPLLAGAAEPPRISGALSLGYDSNPAQLRDGPSLGFAEAALGVQQPLPHSLELEADLWLRDYAGHNDNGRLDLSLIWSHSIGKTQIDLWGSGGWYRDQLVRADERDESAIGATLSRALSARFDLAIIGERRWLAYRHRVLPWAGRPGGVSLGNGTGFALGGDYAAALDNGAACLDSPGGHGGAGQDGFGQDGVGQAGARHGGACHLGPQRRADRLDLLAIDLTWFASPRMRLTLGLDQGWRQSSIPLDAYDQQGARLELGFEPKARLELTAQLGWLRQDYAHAPRQLRRVDHQRRAGLGLAYWRGEGAFFCGLELLDSRSTIKLEAFTQWVGTCGYQRAL